MKEVLSSPLFGIVLSIFAYEVGLYLNKKTGTPLCNPLLVAVALIIAVLQIFHIPLEYYQQGGDVIAIFLAPCHSVAGPVGLRPDQTTAAPPAARCGRLSGGLLRLGGQRHFAVPPVPAG